MQSRHRAASSSRWSRGVIVKAFLCLQKDNVEKVSAAEAGKFNS